MSHVTAPSDASPQAFKVSVEHVAENNALTRSAASLQGGSPSALLSQAKLLNIVDGDIVFGIAVDVRIEDLHETINFHVALIGE